MAMMMRAFAISLVFPAALADLPAPGEYAVEHLTITDAGLEPLSGVTTRDYVITFPSNSSQGQRFPLISYAHGAAGGRVDMLAYQHHFNDLASYGFVVIAPKSCFMGCPAPKNASKALLELSESGGCLPWVDGPQWTRFVYENTRAIDYAKNETAKDSEWAAKIDWSAGVGTAGHSMGGETSVQLASAMLAKKYNVKAMVCEHCLACLKTGDLITTPAMFMTGTGDYEVFPNQVKDAYTKDTAAPKSFRNEKGRGHTEMLDLLVQYNPAVARHAAAFYKVWLNGDRKDYYDIVYGNGSTSFCHYADMYECEHDMGGMYKTSVEIVV